MTNKIFNEINEIYHDTSKDYLRGNINCINKLNTLKLLSELFNNINDNDFDIIFNKYIINFKSSNINLFYASCGMKLDTFDNVQTFLILLRRSIDYTSFKELYDFLLKIKELIIKDKNINSKSNKIFNQINKINALKILLNLINNKNDEEINIFFNKYIIQFKLLSSGYGKLITFDNIESFLLKLERYNNYYFFNELSNNLLETREQIEKESVKKKSV